MNRDGILFDYDLIERVYERPKMLPLDVCEIYEDKRPCLVELDRRVKGVQDFGQIVSTRAYALLRHCSPSKWQKQRKKKIIKFRMSSDFVPSLFESLARLNLANGSVRQLSLCEMHHHSAANQNTRVKPLRRTIDSHFNSKR